METTAHSVGQLLWDTFGEEVIQSLLACTWQSLNEDFPLDSECGQMCIKVVKVWVDNKELFPDMEDVLINLVVSQCLAICFG